MNKKQALVVQILAQKSLRGNAVNRITAPDNLYEEVRKQYQKAEEQLEGTLITVSSRGGRGTQKALTWQPGVGLCVHDTGPSGFPHWSELPDGVLLLAVSLIPELLNQSHQIKTKNKSKDLEEGAKAVLKGSNLPLAPVPPPSSRPVSAEDSLVEEPFVDDEEDEDIYEDEKNDIEEEDEEDDNESSDSQEILGTDHLPEIDNDTRVDLNELLPPAAVIEATEPRKPRRSRKK